MFVYTEPVNIFAFNLNIANTRKKINSLNYGVASVFFFYVCDSF